MNRITLMAFLTCVFVGQVSLSQDDASFLKPPKILVSPLLDTLHTPQNRRFTGIPSMAITSNGTEFAVWYAGITPHEDHNNYVVLARKEKGGEYQESLIVDPDEGGPVRAFDPELWLDPSGRLWFFWAQSIGHTGTISGVWAMTNEVTDEPGSTWSAPKRICDGIMMCKPLVLSSGEWVLPVSTWRLTDDSAKMWVSKDKGRTWMERGAVNVPTEDRSYDEHMIIEKKDGSLWMLVRTEYGIGESHSQDQGRTWSPLQLSNIAHPSARFFIRRLQSGNLLLVKHGPIQVKTKRSHLMAFISMDDGETWSNGLLLDERNGVSYPDGQQTKDGAIHIVYDWNRRSDQEILKTQFTEDAVLSPQNDAEMYKVYEQRQLISKGGSYKE